EKMLVLKYHYKVNNLIQFADLIGKALGNSPFSHLHYGCYSGLGGTKQPLDETDWEHYTNASFFHIRCCHAHDCCYTKASKIGCNLKLEIYFYSIKEDITCTWKSCEKMICECDKTAAACFQKAAKTYNTKYNHYPDFICKGETPSC
uniref:Phospholipase A2 n=1 Tax=Crocodylus porosus TaxID=8502 RepID=A0A7M4FKY9_CROPO